MGQDQTIHRQSNLVFRPWSTAHIATMFVNIPREF